MVESAAAVAPAATPKKAKAAKTKKPKAAPTHPKVSEMVNSAISILKERGGSSLQAIKKYVGSNYKVDVDKLSPFIKKYLKNAVASGTLVQTKGKGASGSFKMTPGTKEKNIKVIKTVPPSVKKAAKPKTPKKSVKKAPKPKLAKSTKKSKTLKPKAPKPKKTKVVKKASPKKKK